MINQFIDNRQQTEMSLLNYCWCFFIIVGILCIMPLSVCFYFIQKEAHNNVGVCLVCQCCVKVMTSNQYLNQSPWGDVLPDVEILIKAAENYHNRKGVCVVHKKCLATLSVLIGFFRIMEWNLQCEYLAPSIFESPWSLCDSDQK